MSCSNLRLQFKFLPKMTENQNIFFIRSHFSISLQIASFFGLFSLSTYFPFPITHSIKSEASIYRHQKKNIHWKKISYYVWKYLFKQFKWQNFNEYFLLYGMVHSLILHFDWAICFWLAASFLFLIISFSFSTNFWARVIFLSTNSFSVSTILQTKIIKNKIWLYTKILPIECAI